MKSNVQKRIELLVIACAVPVISLKAAERGESQDARDALQLINHINCAVAEITESKDPLVLEREYNALTVDSLKLDCIKDSQTIDAINSLRRTAEKLRIGRIERELLKEEQEAEMNDAIYSSMPNIGSLASPNLLSTVVNLTIGAASAYANYEKQKAAIQRRARRQEWQLEQKDIETLEGLNEDLLNSHWSIIRDYGINDYNRVTSGQIKKMINWFKDPDVKRRWSNFKLNTPSYKFSTRFWYYRAIAADAVGEDKEAERSLDEFQRLHLQITRKDKIAALVAMQKVRYLLDDMFNGSNLRKQLGIIEKNAELEDWNLFYFCGLVYADELHDYEKARYCLQQAINELSLRLETRLTDFTGKLDEGAYKKNDHDKIPSAESLTACRMKLQLIDAGKKRESVNRQMVKDILKKENAAILDSLYFIGRTRDIDMFNNICPQLEAISVRSETRWMRNDAFIVDMPVAWFEVGEVSPVIRFGKVSDGGFVTEVEKRELVKTEDGSGRHVYVRLTFRTEIDKLDANLKLVLLEIPHKYCDVKLAYRLPRDKKDRQTAGSLQLVSAVIDGNRFDIEKK